MTATETKKVPTPAYIDASAPTEDIVSLLKRDGGVIIRNIISKEAAEQIRQEILKVQILSKDEDNTFFDPAAARAYSLIQSCPSYSPTILTNKVMLDVVNATLTSNYSYWTGQTRHHAVSHPQLSTSSAIAIGPGAKAQDFHRDDMCWHRVYDKVDSYPSSENEETKSGHGGRDMQVSYLFAASKATFENGATRVIPGSHLWGSERQPPSMTDTEGVAYCEMEAGDALVFYGSVYHAGGQNITKDQWRYLFGASFIRGYYRQEENQYLAVDREIAKKLPPQSQDLIGYSISLPYCGFVALDEPSKLLRGGTFKAKDLF